MRGVSAQLLYEELNRSIPSDDWGGYIRSSQLVGPPGAHSRENIFEKIASFMEIQQANYDGEYGLGLPLLTFDEILDSIVRVCENNGDRAYSSGEDFVSPEAFQTYTEKAAQVAKAAANCGGRVFFGSGHPGSLLVAYAYMGRAVCTAGGHLYNPAPQVVAEGSLLGSFCGVTALMREDQPKHTHGDWRLDQIIAAEGVRPDLAIADHGMAAAAIRSNIPTIAIVDTNDIELLVAACVYPDRVFPIPMHDNAGIENSMVLARYFEHLLK